ncbi:MAG: YihY/virulence factor BrkB family protein, partial [Alistipes sp.]
LIDNLYATFPQNPAIIDYLVEFADKTLARTQGGVVALVGIVMLFWAVIKVFSSIENAFNNIWEVKVSRSMTRQYTDYIAVVMVAPLLWVIANAMTTYAQNLLGFDETLLFVVVSKIASMIVIWIMFTFLYIVIPNTKVRFASALMAGMVAGTMFLLFQWGYVYVQQWMTSYNAIYGSFAALPLFLIWMQTSWQILLFGGELAFAYQNIDKFAEERESLLISYDQRRRVMLAVMLVIVRQFSESGGAVAAEEVRRRLNLPTRIINDVLYQLARAELLIAVRGGETDKELAFAPAKDIHTLTLHNVIEQVEHHGQTKVNLADSPEMRAVNEELIKIAETATEAVDNTRLIDM